MLNINDRAYVGLSWNPVDTVSDVCWLSVSHPCNQQPKIWFHDCIGEKNDGWLFGFYGISTFVGDLMPNSFLYKQSFLF